MSEEKKMTIAEELGFTEDDRLTIEEVMELAELEKNELKVELNKYTKMFIKFMEEKHKGKKTILVMTGLWQETIQTVDREVREMLETLEKEYTRKYKRPTGEYMKILAYEQNKQNYIEEIILTELVYKVR